MRYTTDRLSQEADILLRGKVSIDYLTRVFDVCRQTILLDFKNLRKRGYNVRKIDDEYYTISNNFLEVVEENLQKQVKKEIDRMIKIKDKVLSNKTAEIFIFNAVTHSGIIEDELIFSDRHFLTQQILQEKLLYGNKGFNKICNRLFTKIVCLGEYITDDIMSKLNVVCISK